MLILGPSANHYRRAFRDIAEVCDRAAKGDLSARILHTRQYGDLAPALISLNRLLDMVDAFVRESGASLTYAAEGKFYRPFLLRGMLGDFRRGAETINKARSSMKQRAEDARDLQRQVAALVAAANQGDLAQRIPPEAAHGEMAVVAQGINSLVETVARAIGEVSEATDKLAEGDLSGEIRGEFHGIFDRLKSSVNKSIGTMRQLAGKLTGSVVLVRDASKEISDGSQDLAHRTESSAGTLQQSVAAMVEITETVQRNADNAKRANDLAQAGRDTASRVGEVVREAVGAMHEIDQGSARIGEIVGLIDEIGFQTNLLALNASVEAARAGEAGKGFAVVAQEVRALAQRSASASKDIKSLIQVSGTQTKRGVELVNRAGLAIEDVVQSIKAVAETVGEISHASAEQATGLREVNNAFSNLEEITQQNAALVEQTHAAAQSLATQAQELADLVEFFRLWDDAERRKERRDECGPNDYVVFEGERIRLRNWSTGGVFFGPTERRPALLDRVQFRVAVNRPNIQMDFEAGGSVVRVQDGFVAISYKDLPREVRQRLTEYFGHRPASALISGQARQAARPIAPPAPGRPAVGGAGRAAAAPRPAPGRMASAAADDDWKEF